MHLLWSKNLALLGHVSRRKILQKGLKLEEIFEIFFELITEVVVNAAINDPHG